jgi:hypothetical protein
LLNRFSPPLPWYRFQPKLNRPECRSAVEVTEATGEIGATVGTEGTAVDLEAVALADHLVDFLVADSVGRRAE